MSAIKCEVCGKRMITPKILDAHMAKTHSGNTTENTFVAPEEGEVKKEVEVEAAPKGYVVFTSSDDRKLEASINDNYWKGATIQVPEFFAGQVEDLLKTGKYYYTKS